MKRPHERKGTAPIDRSRFAVILVNPENPENIGLAARAMRNTGFDHLRVAGLNELPLEAFRTAVHSRDILDSARFYPTLAEATSDLQLVLASTARFRKTFAVLTLAQAVETVLRYPPSTRVGLAFGNERIGLTSEELGHANFVYFIPQATSQPSYNLSSAVLLTLFALFSRAAGEIVAQEASPLPRKEQEEAIHLILRKLGQKAFYHRDNKAHVTEMVQGLFGRLALTDRDRRFLLALLDKMSD